ncbi:hypothetical protein AB0H92_25620 [Streptomyces phaeochromogenes]|uniref:TRAFAC clade GTPase domain-containing protein n=1 Tax=Streptomyces phaeochromogenes TaxID=1923 RepID=UPI0033D0D1D7
MPAISVTVLGPAESGKTVYLASLFRRLAIPRPDLGFHVQLPPEQSSRLNRIYQQITSPGVWPDPQRRAEISEWEFSCSVRTARNETYSPFSITYLDYSGEHLTEPDGHVEAGSRVLSRIKESEFLLVLLDGVKVLRFLDGDPRLMEDLFAVFSHLMKSRGIVHFVITKWDVLSAAGHTVQAVMDCLLEHPDFRDAVETMLRSPGGTKGVRFIPVSSVGPDFAALGPDGVTMVKKGGFPAPVNVEIPFMAVLLDLFEAQLKEMERQATASESQQIDQRRQRLVWLRMVRDRMPLARTFLRAAAARSPVMRLVRDHMAEAFLQFVETQMSAYGDRVEQDITQLRDRMLQATSEKEALNGLVALFHAKLAEFEAEHPGSRLIEGESSWTTA